jgi:syntaxin-binding protein 1
MRGETKSAQELYDEKYFVKEAAPPQQPQAPPQKTSFLGLPIQPSPTNSFSSTTTTPSVKEEKKKRRGLLARFG